MAMGHAIQQREQMNPELRMEFMLENLKTNATPYCMKNYKMPEAIIKNIEENNRTSAEAPYQFQTVKDEGYWGMVVPDEVELGTAIEQEDWLRVYGFSKTYMLLVKKRSDAKLLVCHGRSPMLSLA